MLPGAKLLPGPRSGGGGGALLLYAHGSGQVSARLLDDNGQVIEDGTGQGLPDRLINCVSIPNIRRCVHKRDQDPGVGQRVGRRGRDRADGREESKAEQDPREHDRQARTGGRV